MDDVFAKEKKFLAYCYSIAFVVADNFLLLSLSSGKKSVDLSTLFGYEHE